MSTTLTELQDDLEGQIKRYFVDLYNKSDEQRRAAFNDFIIGVMPQDSADKAAVLADAPGLGYFEGDLIEVSNVFQAIEHSIMQQLRLDAQDIWNKQVRNFEDDRDSLIEDGYSVKPFENHFNIYLNNETYHEGLSSETEAWWWLQQGENAK